MVTWTAPAVDTWFTWGTILCPCGIEAMFSWTYSDVTDVVMLYKTIVRRATKLQKVTQRAFVRQQNQGLSVEFNFL